MLAELPWPIANLLRSSWAIHSVSDEDFDDEDTLHFLRNTSLLERPFDFQRLLAAPENTLEIITAIINLYSEVDIAVGIVAQGTCAAMDAFRYPHVVIAPVILSETEHVRIRCSLYVLRIYYQLRSKFIHKGHTFRSKFPTAFMSSLRPWEVEQAVSAEQMLRALKSSSFDFSVFSILDKKYTCPEYLADKSLYIRNYLRITGGTTSMIGPIARNRSPRGFSRTAALRSHSRLLSESSNTIHTADNSQAATQLRNHGWMIYRSMASSNAQFYTHLNINKHKHFIGLGILFWDQDRLAHWDLVDQDDMASVHTDFQHWLERADQQINRDYYCYKSLSDRDSAIAKTSARQIREWTRSSVQCSLEEALYQKPALIRLAEGRRPLKAKYIEIGVVCYVCGLDGHRGHLCHEENWSDGDDEPPSPPQTSKVGENVAPL